MHKPFARRSFLQMAGAGLLLPPLMRSPAVEPFARQGPPRLRLGLAAYSFREFFRHDTHGPRPAPPEDGRPRLDMKGFIDFCAEHGCDGAELTSYYFPRDLTREHLLEIRRHAFLKGVAISGSAVGNTFTHPPGPGRDKEIEHVKTWIDHTALLGAGHLRVFAGNQQSGQSPDQARRLCIEALQECARHAARAGVFLGLENHGGIVAEADPLLHIIREVQSPWVGLNLDTGNFHTEDPYADLEKCAPYAVNVQIKVEIKPRNRPAQTADLERLITMLRKVRYQGYVVLEYEAAPDPWEAVPGWLRQLRRLV